MRTSRIVRLLALVVALIATNLVACTSPPVTERADAMFAVPGPNFDIYRVHTTCSDGTTSTAWNTQIFHVVRATKGAVCTAVVDAAGERPNGPTYVVQRSAPRTAIAGGESGSLDVELRWAWVHVNVWTSTGLPLRSAITVYSECPRSDYDVSRPHEIPAGTITASFGVYTIMNTECLLFMNLGAVRPRPDTGATAFWFFATENRVVEATLELP